MGAVGSIASILLDSEDAVLVVLEPRIGEFLRFSIYEQLSWGCDGS